MYKFGSTHVDFTPEDNKKLHQAWGYVTHEELAEDGVETDTHCTIRYGINDVNYVELYNAIEDQYPEQFTITVTGIGIFENDDDCVHYTVSDSNRLNNLRALVEETADCAPSDHPNYVPHITVAYVQKGSGASVKKRIEEGLTFPFDITCDAIVFSAKDRKRHIIPLKDSKQIAESEILGLVYGRIRSRNSETI